MIDLIQIKRRASTVFLSVLAFVRVVPAFAGPGAVPLPVQAPAGAQGSTQTEWLVVTAPAFRDVLAPLIEKRTADGFQVTVIETTNVLTPEQIRQGDGRALASWVAQRLGQSKGLQSLLLVGASRTSDASAVEQTVLPGVPGTNGRMNGQASDYAYGLPGEDGTPRVAVGRFPGRTVEEIRGMVQKTLRLEQDCQPGVWGNRIVLLQGNPGGGALAEMFVEQATSPRLQRLHPAWSLRAISHSEASVYYLPTSRLRDMGLDYLQAGQLFSLYLGHSDASGLWSNGSYLMSREDWANLNIQHCQGVLFTCGCFACEWSGANGIGYGLAAMRNPHGPAAVIGACGESYSAPGLLAIDGFLGCCSTPPFPVRLADYWLAMQTGLARGPLDAGLFALYDQFDGSGGKVPLSVQRREHLEMWLLLGDPALRLPLTPLDILLDPLASVTAGKQVTVRGRLPDRLRGATVHISIERPLGVKPSGWEKPPDISPDNTAEREKVTMENHRKANNVVLAEADVKPNQAQFECALEIPANLPWPNIVLRAYAANTTAAAIGVEVLQLSH